MFNIRVIAVQRRGDFTTSLAFKNCMEGDTLNAGDPFMTPAVSYWPRSWNKPSLAHQKSRNICYIP